MYTFGYSLTLAFLLLFAVGCSGPASSPLVDTTPVDIPETSRINWSEHEDFDVDKYAEQPDTMKRFHDVPDELLLADRGPVRERSGFRIQILATLDKQEADQAFEDALVWWQGFKESASFSESYTQAEDEPPVYQDFKAPYYFVRVGNFTSRDEAEHFLRVIPREYDRAFVVQGVVRVR